MKNIILLITMLLSGACATTPALKNVDAKFMKLENSLIDMMKGRGL